MIHPLVSEVERIRQVMAQHREYLGATELATCYAVIDPVSKLLGWDVHDASAVKPQLRSGAKENSRVDYALLREGRPIALIEAKPLGTKPDRELERVSTVCVNCPTNSVKWGIVTNGDEWILIDAHDVTRPLQDRVVRRFVLSHGVALAALQEVVSLFGLISGQAEQSTVPAATLAPKATPPPPDVGTTSSSGQPLAALMDLARPHSKVPVVLAMPDGQSLPARNWAGLLTAVIEWLVKSGHLSASHCPLPESSGRSRGLVNTAPAHPDGRAFPKGPHTVGGLYHHTNYDALDCVKNALHVLKTAGLDPASVTWRRAP